jgi:hypothetical protein
MIGRRTLYSLAQFLALQEHSVIYVLLSKYGASLEGTNLVQIADCVGALDPHILLQVLSEVARTANDLRAPVTPDIDPGMGQRTGDGLAVVFPFWPSVALPDI